MRWLFCIAVFFCFNTSFAQNTEVDSLKKLLPKTGENITRINVLEGLSYAYLSAYPDTALQYAMQGLELAKKIKSAEGEAICTDALGNVYFHVGDIAKALEMYLRYLQLKQSLKEWGNISIAYFNLANAYTEAKDFDHALYYLFKAKTEDEKAKNNSAILYDLYSLASIYLRKEKPDSALYFLNSSYKFGLSMNDKNMLGAILNTFGEAYLTLDSLPLAASYYRQSITFATAINDNEVLTANYYGLAKINKATHDIDSSVFYARKALLIAKQAPFFKQVLEISTFLTSLFEIKEQYDSAFFYQQLSIATKDSLFNIEELRKVQNLKFNELQRQQAIDTAAIQYQNQVKLFVAAFIIVVFLLIVVVLWYNNKQKNKANTLLRGQKQEITNTLEKLKATQEQLVHSEKMASLGELTAGIAHEIQNPLNFVNNFSEVNKELIEELKEERSKSAYERDADVEHALMEDISGNLEKIVYHGRRADDIVKSMLQHSRKSTGQKEPADVNKIVDECLRLSYHGLRAKNKTFNSDYKTDLDKNMQKINIVLQDISRVILNILNNAFYAVSKKQTDHYKPLVIISTTWQTGNNRGAFITITDNGIGIPQNILDKIFQPFFTTKPTGQGTGLGLSLSYNIIVKEHGGTIHVNSTEGEGSIFTIFLPDNNAV